MRSASARSPRHTIALYYGLTGVLNALWGAALPAIDARLDLGPARLGGLFALLAISALVAMPITGRLADRWDSRLLLRVTNPASALALIGAALAPTASTLAIWTVVMGLLFGALNVALSIQAVAVERTISRPVMSGLHGIWTLGAVAGGVLVTVGLGTGADVRLVMTSGAVVLVVAGLTIAPPPVRPSPLKATDEPGPVISTTLLVTLGLIGAAGFLTEGAATDWAGIHATRVLGATPAVASFVYTVFFVAMTVVRFAGDALRARFGAERTVRAGGGTASAGYALVLLAGLLPSATPGRIAVAVTGWALAGAGMAVIWPVVVSTLGATAASGRRLSTVTAIGYGGGLAGPALIGHTAAATSLSTALVIPAAVTAIAPTALRRARIPRPLQPTSRP
ncbi:MFS transporter [Kribbella deserti]|uniref:MFS transporter n=1 Tax=Kribbella deserti TaxID=1926257 RepID=A0ABV6QUM1_9ACTN